jgi:hypothetical protein
LHKDCLERWLQSRSTCSRCARELKPINEEVACGIIVDALSRLGGQPRTELAAARALATYASKSPQHCEWLLQAGASEALARVLRDDGAPEARAEACEALAALCAGHADARPRLWGAGVCAHVCSVLARHCGDQRACEAALEALASLAVGAEGARVQEMLDAGAAKAVVDAALAWPEVRVCVRACV